MSPLTIQEILVRLREHRFDALIGHFESSQLECKRAPYRLSEDVEKLELAKDVSALANADGGIILIGWATEKDEVHREDRICGLSPVPVDLFNPAQYQGVLQQWLWPRVELATITTFPSSEANSHVFAAIHVPPVDRSSWPVLLASSALESGKRTQLLLGLCERRRAGVASTDVARLHSLIKDGLRFDSALANEFSSIRALLSATNSVNTENHWNAVGLERIEGTGSDTSTSNPCDDTQIENWINAAAAAAGLEKEPIFYLYCSPSKVLNLRGLFEGRDHPLVKLLHQPPRVRQSGFDIEANINSTIVEGRLRRTVSGGGRILEVHRSGIILFVCDGGQSGLSWAPRSQEGLLRINQLALVEMTYLFVAFAWKLYGNVQLAPSCDLAVAIGLERMESPQGFSRLAPGPLERWGHRSPLKAPDSKFRACVQTAIGRTPELVAVELLELIYNWFGIDSSQIPYTAITDSGRMVSIEQIERVQ
jgi:hypothetical protein